MTSKYILILFVFGMVSCQSKPSTTPATEKEDTAMAKHKAMLSKADLKILPFDYRKDPACGMPLTAGLEDTTHYKGKLYGFCSKECKEVFLKDPKTYLAQIK